MEVRVRERKRERSECGKGCDGGRNDWNYVSHWLWENKKAIINQHYAMETEVK